MKHELLTEKEDSKKLVVGTFSLKNANAIIAWLNKFIGSIKRRKREIEQVEDRTRTRRLITW